MQANTFKHARWRGSPLLVGLVTTVMVAGCTTRPVPAPILDLSSGNETQAAPPPAAGATHLVAPGDTLYHIARQHGISVESLTRLNNLDDPSQLRPGQVLQLTSQVTVPTQTTPPTTETLPVATASTSQVATSQPVPPQTPVQTRSDDSPASTPPAGTPLTPPDTVRPAEDATLVVWDWPAAGRILQTFNANTKGIDLEGQLGDPVKAAADGTVMYAGNGVRGLGNLILLGHRDGFISAYAHNQVLLVKTGQQIKQGTQIATVGQSDTTSPRLHFEIRRSGTPVNPLSYLPPR